MTIVCDYGIICLMDKFNYIAAGEFKAKCLNLMDEVQASKKPLIVTKHGKPVVTIFPFDEKKTFPYGDMEHLIRTKGDIVGPIGERWNAEAAE